MVVSIYRKQQKDTPDGKITLLASGCGAYRSALLGVDVMREIDLQSALEAQEPFCCHCCGLEFFQPNSPYSKPISLSLAGLDVYMCEPCLYLELPGLVDRALPQPSEFIEAA
jgi:hypothetical protein